MLGDLTLGVYALHLAVYLTLLKTGWLGTDQIATSGVQLMMRYLVTLALTYALVIVLRRIPWVKRVV